MRPLVAWVAGLADGWPACVLHELTGLWCPLCGGTRATFALIRGDMAGALRWNAYALVVDVVVVVVCLRVARRLCERQLDRPRSARSSRWSPLSAQEGGALLGAGAVFLIARNIPVLEPVLSASLIATSSGT